LVAKSLGESARAVAQLLAVEQVETSIAACRAIESVADCRRVLVHMERVGEARPDPIPDFSELARPLAATLTSQNARLLLAALYALETFDHHAAPATAAVSKALGNADPFVRWAAARVLYNVAPRDPDHAAPALAAQLGDTNADVRGTALLALERFGPSAAAAVPALRKSLNQENRRVEVIRVLAAIGPAANAVVPDLLGLVAGENAPIRAAAMAALPRVSPDRAPWEKAIIKALDDPDAGVRQAAAEALLQK
jgi:HEAT repeat protein